MVKAVQLNQRLEKEAFLSLLRQYLNTMSNNFSRYLYGTEEQFLMFLMSIL